jgi:hypothetical protein
MADAKRHWSSDSKATRNQTRLGNLKKRRVVAVKRMLSDLHYAGGFGD